MECVLREFVLSDAKSLAKYANNKNIGRFLRFLPFPYTEEDGEEFITQTINRDKQKQDIEAIVVDGEVIGTIGLFVGSDVYCKTAEIGYWIGEEFWGKGIMTTAVKQMCAKGFKNYDIVRIYAHIFSVNTASARVLEKCSFKFEGTLTKGIYKDGVVYDESSYALIKD